MDNIKILIFILISFNSYSQYTGATPWENCYGKNASCEYVGCSDIRVNTSSNSSIVAIVKKYGKVVKHAYISAGSSYTFQVPDGTYQVFFYYGSEWDRNKSMNSKDCYTLRGGFTSKESVSKTEQITLKGQIMTYTLTYTTSGNFSPKSSSLEEAL
jgi:hypothetical protein